MKRVIIAVIVIAGLAGLWVATGSDGKSDTTGSTETTNHSVGAGTKKVTLIEYGDFQCPACSRFYPVLKQLKANYGDDITFTFRHFPLDSIHPNARAAHRAAEAAGNQGKFWEMHDKLYETQTGWSSSTSVYGTFETFAQELQLDMTKFADDYKSEAVNKLINNDIKAGQALEATSTPTFVLNGKKIDDETMNTVSFSEGLDRAVSDFAKIIDAEIAKVAEANGETPAKTTTNQKQSETTSTPKATDTTNTQQ